MGLLIGFTWLRTGEQGSVVSFSEHVMDTEFNGGIDCSSC